MRIYFDTPWPGRYVQARLKIIEVLRETPVGQNRLDWRGSTSKHVPNTVGILFDDDDDDDDEDDDDACGDGRGVKVYHF